MSNLFNCLNFLSNICNINVCLLKLEKYNRFEQLNEFCKPLSKNKTEKDTENTTLIQKS
jgi:hypothetical protein